MNNERSDNEQHVLDLLEQVPAHIIDVDAAIARGRRRRRRRHVLTALGVAGSLVIAGIGVNAAVTALRVSTFVEPIDPAHGTTEAQPTSPTPTTTTASWDESSDDTGSEPLALEEEAVAEFAAAHGLTLIEAGPTDGGTYDAVFTDGEGSRYFVTLSPSEPGVSLAELMSDRGAVEVTVAGRPGWREEMQTGISYLLSDASGDILIYAAAEPATDDEVSTFLEGTLIPWLIEQTANDS